MRNLFLKTLFILTLVIAKSISVASMSTSTIHIVQRGDQLMTISNLYYGTHQRWQEIVAVNPGIDPNDIYVGQEIIIPNPTRSVGSRPASPVEKNKHHLGLLSQK